MGALKYRMSYFRTQARRTQQLTARITLAQDQGLRWLAKLWEIIERKETGDAALKVSVADALGRLLDVGLDGAFKELGDRPRTQVDFEAMRAALEKRPQIVKK